jgi:hypothetical protein
MTALIVKKITYAALPVWQFGRLASCYRLDVDFLAPLADRAAAARVVSAAPQGAYGPRNVA